MRRMLNIKINNIKLLVKEGLTVLQACNLYNANIPKFCFHENLEIAGNCRMCLVEIKNSPKPVASCAIPVINNMEIYTNTPLVKKARENILEFLLINHPLDCPICDQGGECDLQDQTLIFGSDRSRFFNRKVSVIDKNCGPFIKTIMTRCIHCTRCVRFAKEICKIDDLGTVGRGQSTEISFYINKIFNSEFSGNVIDLCPVGALTSKPFAFKTRPWEIKKTESVDILDSVGSNIIVNTFNNNIVRILPKNNKLINIEWISNRTRFFFDSLKYQRLEHPLIKINNKFKKINWEKTFIFLKKKLKKTDPYKIKIVVGECIDIKSLFFLKRKLNSMGVNNINYSNLKKKIHISTDLSNNFIYKDSLNNLNNSDLCLLVNFNPKLENPILLIHLQNSIKKNKLKIITIGPKLNLNIPVTNLGLSLKIFLKILEGKHPFCQLLIQSKNPVIIIGETCFNFNKFKFNKFLKESGFLNFLEAGLYKSNLKKYNEKILLNYNTDSEIINKNAESFKIYQGHHFSENACQSDLILPSLTFLEKKGLYLNVSGFIQKTNKILQNKNLIKDNLSILNVYFTLLNNKILNNNLFIIQPYLYDKKLLVINDIKYTYKKKNLLNFKKKKPLINNLFTSNLFEKFSKILVDSIKDKKKKNFIYDNS